MALQHFQWLVLLTSVVLLTTITSAKKYPVSDAFGERQLRYNVTGPSTDSEDRALPSGLIESMTNHLDKHATEEEQLKKLTGWSESMTELFKTHVTKDWHLGGLTDWLNVATKNTDKDEVPASLHMFFVLWSWVQKEKILKSFKDVKGAEKASLTHKDIERLEMLKGWKNEGMTEYKIASKMLGNDAQGERMLRSWYDWTPNTPKEVTSHYEVLFLLEAKFGYKRLADYAVKKSGDPIMAQVKKTVFSYLYSRLHDDHPTADGFFKVLELEKDKDPLRSPLLLLWRYSLSHFIGQTSEAPSEVFYKTMLATYKTDQALSRAIVSARGQQKESLLNNVQEGLFEKLSRERLVEPFILEFEEVKSLPEESKKAFVAALKEYDSWRRHEARLYAADIKNGVA